MRTALHTFSQTGAVSPSHLATASHLDAPAEELAVFLSIRGMCLREQGRLAEAADSFAAAVRLAPNCAGYRTMLARLESALAHPPPAAVLPSETQRPFTSNANRT